MEGKKILVLLVLNIALPTLDTATDINLVYKLYHGAHYCYFDVERFDYNISFASDYKKCTNDPVLFCDDVNYQNVCRFSRHPKIATALLTPFLLNYFVCFQTFLRKGKNQKYTFIFALLNIYPQFGMNNHEKRNHWNNYF